MKGRRPYRGDAKVLSCFNRIVTNCKRRAKDKGFKFNIDEKYLLKVYKIQKGRCAYTHKKLLIYTEYERRKLKHFFHPAKASVDRIDPSKGYIKGNVQLVSLRFNAIKNDLNNNEMVRLFKHITNPINRGKYKYLLSKLHYAV